MMFTHTLSTYCKRHMCYSGFLRHLRGDGTVIVRVTHMVVALGHLLYIILQQRLKHLLCVHENWIEIIDFRGYKLENSSYSLCLCVVQCAACKTL